MKTREAEINILELLSKRGEMKYSELKSQTGLKNPNYRNLALRRLLTSRAIEKILNVKGCWVYRKINDGNKNYLLDLYSKFLREKSEELTAKGEELAHVIRVRNSRPFSSFLVTENDYEMFSLLAKEVSEGTNSSLLYHMFAISDILEKKWVEAVKQKLNEKERVIVEEFEKAIIENLLKKEKENPIISSRVIFLDEFNYFLDVAEATESYHRSYVRTTVSNLAAMNRSEFIKQNDWMKKENMKPMMRILFDEEKWKTLVKYSKKINDEPRTLVTIPSYAFLNSPHSEENPAPAFAF